MNRLFLHLSAVASWFWRLFRRTKLKAQGRLAETSTMADYQKLLALPDDKGPVLVKPKDGPYADLINRVRFYAKDGAKALGPLLDGEMVPDDVAGPWAIRSDRRKEFVDDKGEWLGVPRYVCWGGPWSGALANTLLDHTSRSAKALGDQDAEHICSDMLADVDPQGVLQQVTAAYNSPWTVKDGEVFEVVTDRRTTH